MEVKSSWHTCLSDTVQPECQIIPQDFRMLGFELCPCGFAATALSHPEPSLLAAIDYPQFVFTPCLDGSLARGRFRTELADPTDCSLV